MSKEIDVIKRDGRIEAYDIAKIKQIIQFATKGLAVNPLVLEATISSKVKTKIKTSEIQFNLISSAVTLTSIDEPDWTIVAGRLEMYNLRREVYKLHKIDYNETSLYDFIKLAINYDLYDNSILEKYTKEEMDTIQTFINPDHDLIYPISSTKSLLKKYLIRYKQKPFELPQFANIVTIMFLNQHETEYRLKKIKEDYEAVASLKISLATPFKANLRKPNANLSSCFILEVDDTAESINHSLKDIAMISKFGGGVGVYLGRLRPSNALVQGHPGANNINKWVKIIDDMSPAWNQGGTRKGAMTISIDVFHKDIESFIELKTESGGDLREKCFNIFPQVIVNSKFVEAVKNNDVYPLLDRTSVIEALDIDICDLKQFNDNYDRIVELVKNKKLYNCELTQAKALWKRILEVYVETGDLYVVCKDTLNKTNPFYDEEMFTNSYNLCLSGDTRLHVRIKNEVKLLEIKDLENIENYEVLSRNILTKKDEWKVGYEFTKSKHKEYYEITDLVGSRSIKCTKNHKIWTQNRGFVVAEEITTNDILWNKDFGNVQKLAIKKVMLPQEEEFYDINVFDNHNFYANDILVHNCTESTSPARPSSEYRNHFDKETNIASETFTPGRTHTCNLISLNVSEMSLDEINQYAKRAVRMLDNAIDVTKVPVIEGELLSNETRIIGVGIMGLADFLAKEKKSYERDHDFIESVFERVAYYTLQASVELAKERGAFEIFNKSSFTRGKFLGKTADELMSQSITKEFDWVSLLQEAKNGVRNSQLFAVAPNTSSSLLCACSASYLPIFSKFSYENLEKMNVPVVPKYLKDRFWYYKEYPNIEAKVIINLTNRLHKWIDTGISMEVVISEKDNIKDISDALLNGFSDNLKALYYSRTISREKVSCVSCAN